MPSQADFQRFHISFVLQHSGSYEKFYSHAINDFKPFIFPYIRYKHGFSKNNSSVVSKGRQISGVSCGGSRPVGKCVGGFQRW